MQIIETTTTKKKNNKKIWLFILLILLGIILGITLTIILLGDSSNENGLINKLEKVIVTKERAESEIKVSDVQIEEAIEKVYDSVLCIEVMDSRGNLLGSGTGFVYSKDEKYGYILTNAHVVESGTNIVGTLTSGVEVKLERLGIDTYMDLAVLRMDAKNIIKVATLGNTKNTNIGGTVFTVGSPMGKEFLGTVTKGILSNKDRYVERSTGTYSSETVIVKVIQTDAAISPGNSGGPLVNVSGDVIGINSMKLVDSSVEGMGFAIPIEDALEYINDLENKRTIKRPYIGVSVYDILTNKDYLISRGANIPENLNYGIYIIDVEETGSAYKSGIRKNDIITHVNDVKIDNLAKFKYELFKHKIGESIEVTYYRNNKKAKLKIELKNSI